jgi:enhancing lycopene biosynthesis protein 2
LLLDSCSSSDLIANEELLTNIHQADHPLNVQCNAGSIVVKDKGLLGTYPKTVWHNKNGVANILSMHNASKHFRITMDTDVEELLTNIHQADHPLNVQCNAGSIVVKDKGLLGTYPETVWHNKNGVANILSMHNASKHFRITMDTDVEDAICLHKPDGNVM